MWCNGNWFWMTVGMLTTIALLGTFVWLLLDLIRPHHDPTRLA
jgi:hypothetical protein